jgi:uncharacterized membrane protein YebE (DUF533 family)
MSLVRTLAKVAAGVMVARTVKGMVGGGRPGGVNQAGTGSGSGSLQDVLGQVLAGGGSARSPRTGGGSLQDMLGEMLGGGATRRGAPAPGGSLQDMLGQILGGGAAGTAGGAAGGGLGGMLNELSRMSRPGGGAAEPDAGTDFGTLLNQSLEGFNEPRRAPSRDEEEFAGVLLRAMVQAAKADGQIDADEKERLLGQLGDDVSRDEAEFVRAELAREVDVDGLARAVPAGAEQQVYLISAMAIDLDRKSEATYLHELAQAMQLSPASVNAIHDRLGIQRIYR